MLELHYSDGFVVTTEAVADAVMRYAKALAEQKASDLITLSISTPEGPATSAMLIGPASQLHTTPHPHEVPQIDDTECLMELLGRHDRLIHPPAPMGEHPYEEDDPWYEESF